MITKLFSTNVGTKNGAQTAPAHPFRIGERVQNGGHGTGVVRAFHPNGTIIVRFEGQETSRAVFPTFLEKKGR